MRTRLLTLSLAAGLALAAGCHGNCRRPGGCPAPGGPPGPPGTYIPPPGAPGQVLPPGQIPPPPPGGSGIPPPPQPIQPGGGFSGFTPPPSWASPSWQAADAGRAQLGQPELDPPPGGDGVAKLHPPEVGEQPGKQPVVVTEQPKAAQQKAGASPFPVGIPQFTEARERVAAGLRPMLDDGLDWLQSSGYKTVLQLRRPGEENAADRREVEKRGMKYVSLEVSPEGLTKDVAQEFSRRVTEGESQPLFVYDRDGSLAGALWYLHFRSSEGMGDEAARVRAASLGLREDREGAHRAMWDAARRVLEQS